MATSLAVSHRPRRFADVAGQRHVSAVLRSAAARQTPPVQTLLAGPSGLGKTTLARIFAAALFCEQRASDGDACGTCESCTDVTGPGGYHPDVVELDAASNGGKDEIREIAARANLAPLRAPWKVYIIDEAHGLTGPGGQAMLKLLEEPPGHVLFILATTDPDKLPPAVRGRCTISEVLPPTRAEMVANLRRIAEREGWSLSEQACEAVIDATDPALGMRGTVMTLEKLAGPLAGSGSVADDDLEALLGTVAPSRLSALTGAILDGDRPGALLAVAELSGCVGGGQLRRQLTSWARAELLDACRERRGVEAAYHRYELVVSAGSYPGALEVAVARMASPGLDTSTQAASALLERAEDALEMLARISPAAVSTPAQAAVVDSPSVDSTAGDSMPVTPPVPPAAPAPEPADSADPTPLPPPAAPTTAVGAVSAPVSSSPDELLVEPLGNPDFVTVLNVVGKASARAATVLRRCTVARTPTGLLRVSVPADVADRATAADLLPLLESLSAAGSLPQLATPVR